MHTILTPAVRRWVYGVAIAALPLLIAYGILDEQTAPLWAAAIGAILVPTLAVTHVDAEPGRHREDGA